MFVSTKKQSKLKKGRAFFNLVGEVRLSDFTYNMDITSDSGWQYHRLNLGVDCGNGNVVYADMMGGFWGNGKPTELHVNSKEDFTNRYTIDWEDRFLEPILETIHSLNFIRVGIEKDTHGKTFTKQFLSEYDAIEYIQEHLEDGMVVNVRGDLVYSMYNDNIQVNKEITSIFLSKAEPENYRATFVQSILIGENCVGKYDKELNSFPIDAHVLDYTKMYNGKEVRTTVPFFRQFELENNLEKPNITKALITKFFKVDKDITEIIVEGKIIEGQQTKNISEDDIPDDIKELIELGIYNKDEILNKMAVSGDRVRRFIITKPYVQMKGDSEDDRRPQLFIEPNKYKEEDLILDFMFDGDKEEESDIFPDDVDADDDSWLSQL
jgi:hypothetical protein